jgi:hypothetical protein
MNALSVEVEITSRHFSNVSVKTSPLEVDVQFIGIKGDKGDQGEMGNIFVGATPPPDPEVNDLWVDIS